jgi:hypothetical protein
MCIKKRFIKLKRMRIERETFIIQQDINLQKVKDYLLSL